MSEKEADPPRRRKRLRTRPDGTVQDIPVDPRTVRALARKSTSPVRDLASSQEKIALRCWVEPEGWQAKVKPHRKVRWKEAALFVHTAGAVGESGPLWFGVAFLATPQRVLRQWIFYREGIPASDMVALAEVASRLGWPQPVPLGDYKSGFLRAFKSYA